MPSKMWRQCKAPRLRHLNTRLERSRIDFGSDYGGVGGSIVGRRRLRFMIGTRAPKSLIDDDGAVGVDEKKTATSSTTTPNRQIDKRGDL